MVITFSDLNGEPAVRGFLHEPEIANGDGLVLSHGAGSNCESKVLVGLATAIARSGFEVLRIDLPFRQARRYGPPFPSSATTDREGIRRAANMLRARVKGRVFAGGHSYGGRQTTILASHEPNLVQGLLLLSYPLHPPGKPSRLRTEHFPKLTKPTLFVHGTRDPFGSIEELRSAVEIIPGQHQIIEAEGAGHDLRPKSSAELYDQVAREFQAFIGKI